MDNLSSKQDWHSIDANTLFKRLNTSEKGLSEKEARKRFLKFGANKLPEEKAISKFKIILDQFKSPLIYILVIAGIITLSLQKWTDSVVIFAAVFLNSAIGYFQENKTSEILSKLKKAVHNRAIVIRDGKEKEIEQKNIVIGDVIMLRPGDKAPADAKLIENFSLKMNESALTGEWLASDKSLNKVSKGAALADRKNIVYMGTIVESGKGKAIVFGIGINTEIGKIATALQSVEKTETPYQIKIAKFSKIIAIIVTLISGAIFIGGFVTGRDILEMFITSVAIAVAAIPEGLPVAITVILALGMERILKKRGLVRRLVAAEVLGSTSIICTDKTGTLTQAKMQVSDIFSDSKDFPHELAQKIGLLCSESFVENMEDPMHKWIVRGRPTEKAVLVNALQSGLRREKIEIKEPKIDMLSFDSIYKYSAALHSFNTKQDIIYILGAPEIILNNSKFFETNKGKEKISKEKRNSLQKKFEKLNSIGLRMVATGYVKIDKNSLSGDIKKYSESGELSETQRKFLYEKYLKDLVFVAFVAIQDPIRADVKEAMKTVKQAGIKPIIVTGDHRLTAQAIAKELGIPAENKNIIDGPNFEKLSDKEFRKRLKDITIYARMEPQQKLRIVEAWQKKGEVVAMTGDGVNDAPALKKANIGTALGSGTDVAKEASDLVLLSDSFSIIITAIKEGRTIIDNVRKVITLLFSNAFGEMILIGASIIAGWPLPILPAQILWVNLIEDSLPAVSLGFEKSEKGVMKRKPENPKASILTSEIKALTVVIGVVTSFVLLGLYVWLLKKDINLNEIRTIVFASLAIDTIFYVFSCKNLKKNIWQINPFSNIYLVLSWFFAILMLLGAIYIPFFQTLLKTVPLNGFDWLLVFTIGIVNLILIEITKSFYKNKL